MPLQPDSRIRHTTMPARSARLPALAVTAGLHAALVFALLSHAPTRQSLAEIAPIMVSMIRPQAAEAPRAQPRPDTPAPAKQTVHNADPKPQPLPAPAAAGPAPAAIQAPPPMATPAAQEPAARTAPAAVTPPQFNADYLNNPAPRYPALSIRLREEGTVMLRVQVDEQGLPARVELRSSSGFERLDGVAQETVRRWKFVPARRGDQPVTAWVLVPISFNIRS